MLDDALKAQLTAYLAKLQRPIELIASLDGSDTARRIGELLAELRALSPLVSVREDGTATRRPSFAVGRPGEPARIHFVGLPMGHEFTSLVLALLQTGGHPPKVDPAVIEQVRALQGRFDFEIFISLACHNCPDVVQALNLMAVLNPDVSCTMIDGALVQAELSARQILAVPAVYLNGEPFGQGRMSLEEIVAQLDTGAAAREVEQLDAKEPFDVLVVGGKQVTGLLYTDRPSGDSRRVELDGIFVQIGLLPNTTWLKDTLGLTRYGEIEIDARGQTSLPGVFAAGDCTTVPYKQIIVAMGEGTKASLSAFDHLIRSGVPAPTPGA